MEAKITKRIMDSLTYQITVSEGVISGSRATCYCWDTTLTGFGCRIYPSGAKSFVVAYTLAGRRRILVLGPYGVLTVEQARALAQTALAEALAGVDPGAAKAEARKAPAVGDLCTAYLERHAKAKKRSWTDDQRRIDRHLLPAWGARKARDITRADVAALHSRIGKAHPYEANRTLALIHKMYGLAEAWGFVPEGHPNPARAIDRFAEVKRDRWITPAELPRLAEAINSEPNQSARFALWLYLLTGLRKSELLKARWEDVDLGRRELRLPTTKAGRTHYIPLSEPAVALLREIPRDDGNPHLFPGAVPGAALVNIDKPWRRVRTAAGIQDARLHDLRRTVGSWLAQAGNSLHLIGRVLNHTSPSTTAVYARFGQDQAREALEQHAQRLLGAAGLRPTAEVVEIGGKLKKEPSA